MRVTDESGRLYIFGPPENSAIFGKYHEDGTRLCDEPGCDCPALERQTLGRILCPACADDLIDHEVAHRWKASGYTQ